MVLRRRQQSIGYMGDGFFRSKDPTNSTKVLKERLNHHRRATVVDSGLPADTLERRHVRTHFTFSSLVTLTFNILTLFRNLLNIWP